MDRQLEELIGALLDAMNRSGNDSCGSAGIPVGVSNHHVHLSQKDMDTLFGPGYSLTKMKDLSQPGQFACRETVTIVGPRGAIEHVRVLGPVRTQTQVEILCGDGFKLGISAPLRMSGDLSGTPGITIVGPKGCVQAAGGLMIAQRHIHMRPEDASHFGVANGDVVSIRVEGDRGGEISHVKIRVSEQSALECHVDTEEANALGLSAKSAITIVKA
ncbi:phosphate propanoyltransferase [Dysosmobacter sp.]|uniref:phosphate propanoyltransferase n=1 Tax=Dysosmobacter sp. TaxID=2591382 RepID=UPI003AB5613E